ncbi:winged helix-turn-helix transcriptional regulator [Candidatus Bathyarchaeota archaeon]|jgi:ArsR family transcriptional regulator, arsenate/arsenite/antimonite-responsive transcriptional repressor|nr:winged helix-turn-helix transcriptional regulator [Candidatus Bathyarchaeota archaeon]
MSLFLPDDKILEFKSRIFKVIGDANRLKIIEILRSGENCQCEIIPLIAQSQPTVSRHLKLLEEAGLIMSRKEGTKTFYQVVDGHIYTLIDAIDDNMRVQVSKEIAKKYSF